MVVNGSTIMLNEIMSNIIYFLLINHNEIAVIWLDKLATSLQNLSIFGPFLLKCYIIYIEKIRFLW